MVSAPAGSEPSFLTVLFRPGLGDGTRLPAVEGCLRRSAPPPPVQILVCPGGSLQTHGNQALAAMWAPRAPEGPMKVTVAQVAVLWWLVVMGTIPPVPG